MVSTRVMVDKAIEQVVFKDDFMDKNWEMPAVFNVVTMDVLVVVIDLVVSVETVVYEVVVLQVDQQDFRQVNIVPVFI